MGWLFGYGCLRVLPDPYLSCEFEIGRRAFSPQLRHLRRGHCVGAAVDFDERELRRVVAQAIFRRAAFWRIESSRSDQALIGPRRGADEYRAHSEWGRRRR
jgi:hypothetical protein